MRLALLVPALLVLLTLIAGCSAGVIGSGPTSAAAAQAGPFAPRVLASGRSRCALSFVESAQGAIDPTGRYIALPGFCSRSSRFGDFVVEVIDLERERSVQLYDFDGERQGYPFFTTEGDLVAISQISIAKSPEDPYLVPQLRYHIWGPDYSDAPRVFDVLTEDERLGGSPRDIVVDPLEPRIALFWRERRTDGAIELVSLAGGRPEQISLLDRDTVDWVTGETGSFNVENGLWVGPDLLMANEYIRVNDPSSGLDSGAGHFGWVVFNVDTGALLSEPNRDGPIRLVVYPDNYDVYLGQAERRLPNGILVVTGENTGPASQQHPGGAHELALRRSEDFSLIGGVPAFVANRQLAGYDFSPDGERVYLLKRNGELEIRATRSWELEASIQVSRYIRGGASEVIASSRPNQVVLVGGHRWVMLELDMEP